ncbi:MAG: hypothetical protein NNA30_10515 [Nitrospira sp.]|nr:hypothetical protein [Nitrospira sp.]
MAPLTAWMPVRAGHQDLDFVVKVVGHAASECLEDWVPVVRLLASHGFSAMAQVGTDSEDGVLAVRIADKPFYSTGSGCDVLIHLSGEVPEYQRVGVQPGSILLWEPPSGERAHRRVNQGMISYAIPLNAISAPLGDGMRGKHAAALGALLHLLGVPEDLLHRQAAFCRAPRSFIGGVEFAEHSIAKRDAYSLPWGQSEVQCKMVLGAAEAVLLGYAAGACECGTACGSEMTSAPERWVERHLGVGGSAVSVSASERYPGIQVYQGYDGKVRALLGGSDSAIAACLDECEASHVFVAADVLDAMQLIMVGHHLIRGGLSDGVWIVIEQAIARRYQSIAIKSVAEVIDTGRAILPSSVEFFNRNAALMAEQDREREAEIGFVAWGAAQGVVRDAVELCRGIGLPVAALYPKCLVPFEGSVLETFMNEMRHVVFIESAQGTGCWRRARTTMPSKAKVLAPAPGETLTPLDIFLHEALGAA